MEFVQIPPSLEQAWYSYFAIQWQEERLRGNYRSLEFFVNRDRIKVGGMGNPLRVGPHVSPLKIEKRNVISMPKWVSPPPLIFSPSSKEGHSSPGRVLCIWVLDLPGLPSIVLINFLQCSIEREREREREQDYYIIQKIDPIMLCGYFIDYGALDGVYCPLINVNPSHVRIIGSVLPASLFI